MGREETRKALRIRSFETDLRRLRRPQLAEHFASARSGRILMAPLMRNVIWQAHERIESGQERPIQGNLRTFFYRFIKPVLARIWDDEAAKRDPYETMTEVFRDLVLDHHLFRYADFDFVDENWENRRIGTTRPAVLVFAEKTGWVRFLREVHTDLGVSTLALGGAPSALTSEYTATHLLEAMGGARPVRLIGIVDFDPSGTLIARAFQKQLAAVGLPETTLSTVIHPRHYSADEVELFRFPLPRRQPTKTARWLEETNGIGGERFGLEAESMPPQRVRQLVEQHLRAAAPPPAGPEGGGGTETESRPTEPAPPDQTPHSGGRSAS